MKISNIMQKCIASVTEDTPLKEVGRHIFSFGISAVPVVRDGKLVGIVTESDMLRKMYPSMEELAEDYIHLRDFEQMERNLKSILDSPVSEVMNKRVKTISPDTPIMNAQSTMLVNEFSHLPVVDNDGKLVGIVSQGDIFRRLIKDEIPKLEREKYADFISQFYDSMVDWEKRFKDEFPALINLFEKEKVKNIIDLGSWTGEYTLGLLKKGKYNILGLDHNPEMISLANKKREELSENLKHRIDFTLTDYKNITKEVKEKFDVALSVGNALPYFPIEPQELFKNTAKVLKSKNALFVLHTINFDKILESRGRLLNFKIEEEGCNETKERLVIEFFERKGERDLKQHLIVFNNDGKNWLFRGLTSIDIHYFNKEDIEKAFKKAGFKKINFYGSKGEYKWDFGKLNFDEKFDSDESDWLIAVAKK